MIKKTLKKTLDLQTAHASGVGLVTSDNKVHELLFVNLNTKGKSMKILDFVIIRGQQLFEERKEINPIEIKIEDDKTENIFEKFKNSKVRFKFNGILFTSSVKNTAERIFLTNNRVRISKICSFKQRV